MQKKAVEHRDGPLLILAGAGSGKTATMTRRIARLLETGVKPWEILAVTFTNKAAREMRERVGQLTGEAGDIWIMTFHAMCLRFLHTDPGPVGYDRNFTVYDTQDQKTLVKNIMKEQGISDHEYKPRYFLAVISRCKEKGQDPEMFRDESLEAGFERGRTRVIYDVFSEYDAKLKENGAMDFDDLLLNTVRLFQAAPEVLNKYQDRFRYIMVDEYQDTNHIQYEIIRMLADKHRNLCVVGDDDQCIYEWRGADINNILNFEKDFPETKVIKLEQNYRSTGNILTCAHSVIRNNIDRKSKKLWTDRPSGDKVVYHRLDNDKEEASYVARQILFMNRNGRSFNDFAVLYRTNAQSRLFEEAFSRNGIPCQVLSGMRYYDRKEIKDAMAYMRLIVNPKDDLSFMRVVNEPKRGIGEKTMAKLQAFANVRGQSILEGLSAPDREMLESIPGKAYERVKDLVSLFSRIRENRDRMSILDIFDTLIGDSGYLTALHNGGTTEDESRIDNLLDFRTVIVDYEKTADEPSLEDFMEGLTLAAEVDSMSDDGATVKLMTMHSAKGLEFPVVFMPGLEDGLFPGNKAFDDLKNMEEERRLCYVGMTRAKEILYLTSAEQRTRYGRTDYTRESQFLREIDRKVLTGDAVYRRSGTESTSLGISTGSRDGFSERPYNPFGADETVYGEGFPESRRYTYGREPDSGFGRRSRGRSRADETVFGGVHGAASGLIGGNRGGSGAASGRAGNEMNRNGKAAFDTSEGVSVTYAPGDVIIHKKFGRGTVIDVSGDKNVTLTVAFDSAGIKKLAADVAPIEKAEN